MTPINSRVIKAVDYNASTQTLTVLLPSGKPIVYSNIPKCVYEQFMAAPSKGVYYNQFIKGKY